MKPPRIYTQYRKGGIGACMSLRGVDRAVDLFSCIGVAATWEEAGPHVYCSPPTSLFPWSFHVCSEGSDDYVGEKRIDRKLRWLVRQGRGRK